jgi:protein-S-isoprenylcysteine O-methyltransferase Ste14
MKEPEGDHPDVIAYPPVIVTAFIALGWLADRLWALPVAWPSATRITGAVVIAVSGILLGWTLLVFRRHHTDPDPFRPTTRIITTGPFRWSRNPIYAALLGIHLGSALSTTNGWMVVLILPAIYTLVRGAIAPEERYLEGKFGDEYRDYRARVRRWL